MRIKWLLEKRTRYQTVLALLWGLWGILLLGVYYTQLWHLLAGSPSAREAFVRDGLATKTLVAFWGAALGFLVAFLGIGNARRAFNLPGLCHSPARWRWHGVIGLSALLLGFVLWRYAGVTRPILHRLPALPQALTRVAHAVFGAGMVLLAASVLGAGICKLIRCPFEDRLEQVLYPMAVGFGVLSYLSLGLAALGLYRPLSVEILIAVILLGGLGYKIVVAGNQPGPQISPTLSTRAYPGDRAWQAVILLALGIALVGALAPEIEYDALWYHLWLPKLWLAQGRPVDLIAEYISLYPLTWELLYGAALPLGGPVAAKLLHFACLALGGMLTYQLTRRFVPKASPWLAVAFFVTIPTVLWEATTAYIDLALALYTGLTLYALLRYAESHRWQWFVLAATTLGLAMATKHLAFFVLVLSTAGLALWVWHKEHDIRRAFLSAALLGGISLLIPLPWYLRSWLASGNPVFPDLFSLFGAFPPERWNAITEHGLARFKAHFGQPRTLPNLLTLPWNMVVHAASYGGNLGPLFPLLLPGLVLKRLPSRVILWLASFCALYLALWATPVSSFQMRFLVPITPLLAVLAAAACHWEELARSGRWATGARAVFQAALALLLLLNLPPFTSLHERDRVEHAGWLTHVVHRVPVEVVVGKESEESYLARSVPAYRAWEYINQHLPADARILTFSGGDQFYSNRERIWSDATIAHPAVWGAPHGQEEQALRTLAELGVSHILCDKLQLSTLAPDTLAIVNPTTVKRWYALLYEDERFVLYRLRWDELQPRLEGKGL